MGIYIRIYSKISRSMAVVIIFIAIFFASLTAKTGKILAIWLKKHVCSILTVYLIEKIEAVFSGAGRVESIAHTYVSSSSSAFGLGKDFLFLFCCLYPSISTFAW